MSEVTHITNDAAPPVLIPKGTSVSADPIEGGVSVINAAVPPGEDGHIVHRTLSTDEQTARDAATSATAGWSRKRALGYLRLTRTALLEATDYFDLPGAADRYDAKTVAAFDQWRQQLRDLPATTTDPDEPAYPAPPKPVPGLAQWATLWPDLAWGDLAG